MTVGVFVMLYQKILLTFGPIWFSFTVKLLKGHRKVILGEGMSTLPKKIVPEKKKVTSLPKFLHHLPQSL